MNKKLTPRSTSILPRKSFRQFHIDRNLQYGPQKFETYNDWFYFIHVDPVIRWWHALGMVIGMGFYLAAASEALSNGITWTAGGLTGAGMFFFYFLPLISHYVYDGGSAKSTPDRFHSTLYPVIHINLLTLTGRYDRWLRTFIGKYPFTREAWDLREE